MRSLLLLLLAVPMAANAAPLDWGVDGAGTVDIAGPVEVPLYRGEATGWLPAVAVQGPAGADGAPAVELFMAVELGGGLTRVDAGTVAKLGLKSKKTKIAKNPVELVTIPELHVGGVTLKQVRALVGPGTPRLGVGTLPEIAAAILPTTGTVKLVPAASAEALLGEVGAGFPLQRVPARKFYEFAGKKAKPNWGNGVSSHADGAILGAKAEYYVSTSTSATKVDENVPLTADHRVAGLPVAEDAPMLAGVRLAPVLVQHDGSISDPKGEVFGRIGYDALYDSDIAYAPSLDRMALRKAAAIKASDPAVKLLETAKARFEYDEKKAAEKPEEPAKTTDHGDPGLPGATGRHTALANALKAAGQWDAAIAEYTKAAATAGDHCEPYLALGSAALASGQPEAAITPLTRAGELWDRWYAQDLEGRQRLADGQKADLAFTIVQASSCNGAWSQLATAQLALGKHDEVARIYRAHKGTDPDVPFAYGLSLLVSGRADAANGPLREAIGLGGRRDLDVRSALSVASTQAGAAASASAQLDVLVDAVQPSLVSLLPYVEALRAAGGDAAALDGAKAAVKRAPWSSAAQLLLVRELKKTASADLPAAQARLDELVRRDAALQANSRSAGAVAAAAQSLAGGAEGAKAWFAANPGDKPDYWAAKAIALEGTSDAKAAVDAVNRSALTAMPSVKLGG